MSLLLSLPSTMNPLGEAVSQPQLIQRPSPLLAPKIDPVTNDFLSLIEGMDHVDAMVINALKIVRKSGPSVMEVGNRFRDIKKIKPETPGELKSQVRTALAMLIRRGDIRYVGATIDINDPGNQTVQITIQWVNLRSFDNSVRSTKLELATYEV